MKFSTLEYFVTLSESRSINEAARKLFISQPSLTKSLHILEEELNTQLFYRSSSGIELTPAGKKFLPEARLVLEYYHGWKKLASEPLLEQIDIYSYTSFPDFLIPDIILQFHKKYPDITINYHTTASPESHISRSIHRPVISLIVCGSSECGSELTSMQGNEPLVLMKGDYRCILNVNHPLANRSSIRPEDLRGFHFVTPDLRNSQNDNLVSRIIQDLAAADPAHKTICMETVNNVIRAIDRNSDIYALAYYPALKRYPGKNLVAIPFEGIDTRGRICAYFSRDAYFAHPVLKEIIHAIQDRANQFLSEQC